jgi:ATP phosphoribosyltransferase
VSVTIALAKGRLQDETVARLALAGVRDPASELESRRLRIEDESGAFKLLLVKPSDVPVYVEYGVADAGVCGSDVLVESGADVHEPLDLGFGRCRMVVAARAKDAEAGYGHVSTLRVATKYPRTTAEFFRRRGVPVEIVVLSGSVELAPLTGLAERIVDLVESGRTLAENGLEVTDTIADVSARLAVNRASYQLKRGEVARLIEMLTGNHEAHGPSGLLTRVDP